ncbi:hypothetical protein CPB84DRAFT_1750737 [Gymnopilus junonius]|uniref:receptor protein-tyrosine kinase n=1 Tax=Gymnopilus junonius TaxID=109634 RepID=A0A9P5NFJ8_GYMJU|nr:hypothetical protein CPB84DRAFT_1750737 [Gymnopilus junonius]
MSNQVIIDDIDSAITYSGGWQEIEGSTRQWGGGTVHSTTQQGASASISFSGTRIKMYCTLFHGLGNEIANINFNGKTSTVSTPSQPQDVFNQIWFDSGEIPSGRYTFVISNGGGPSDTPFQLDRFVIEGLVVTQQAPPPTSSPPAQSSPPVQSPSPPSTQTQVPESNPPTTTPPTLASVIGSESDNFAASGPLLISTLPTTNPGASSVFTSSELLTVGTATAPGQTTVVSIQSIQDVSTTSIEDGSSPTQTVNSPEPASLNTVSRKTPIGAVVGGVIGGLLFLIMLLLGFVVLRRQMKARRHTKLAEETEGGAGEQRLYFS